MSLLSKRTHEEEHNDESIHKREKVESMITDKFVEDTGLYNTFNEILRNFQFIPYFRSNGADWVKEEFESFEDSLDEFQEDLKQELFKVYKRIEDLESQVALSKKESRHDDAEPSTTNCKVGRMSITMPSRDLNKDVDTKTIRNVKRILEEIRKEQMNSDGEVRDEVFAGLLAYVKETPNRIQKSTFEFATYLAIRNCLQSYEVWQSKQPYASLLDKTPFRLAKIYVGKQLRDTLKEYLLARAYEDLCCEFASLHAFDTFYSNWVTDEEFLYKKAT
jgi:gas vesicle protein